MRPTLVRHPVRMLLLTVFLLLAPARPGTASNCGATSVGRTPLPELGAGLYQGFPGGLYPGGSNTIPAGHQAAGVRAAARIQPRDAAGNPDPDGKIVVLTFGMSNTSMESEWLVFFTETDPRRNPAVVFVNGAIPGLAANGVVANGALPVNILNGRLAAAGVTAEQVQVLWYKQAWLSPVAPFPQHAQALQAANTWIVQELELEYAHLEMILFSTRAYGGYAAPGSPNPEPYAYETGFSYKWLIEAQIQGDPALNHDPSVGPVRAPWLAWAPYLWADGETRSADGWNWQCSDFQSDGTHPAFIGALRVGGRVAKFFRDDPLTATWYLAPAATDAPLIASGPAFTVGSPRPNPFEVRLAVPIRVDTARPVDAAVFSLQGRRLRTLHSGELSAGAHEFVWDGRDADHRRVPAGVYLVRVASGGEVRTLKTTLVR